MNLKVIIAAFLMTGVMFNPVYADESESRGLPPALQKKTELPPGWQDKLVMGQPLDEVIFNHGVEVELRNNPAGVITIRVENRIIRVVKTTREVVDIF